MSDVQSEKKQKDSEKNALQSKEQELARDQGTEVETEDDQKNGKGGRESDTE